MKLIIAEKPSVSREIAKIVGANSHRDGYLEGGGWLVSWCVGHLVSLALPDAYDEKYKRRSIEDLPIFPDTWIHEVKKETAAQFNLLKSLMERPDVASLICATDSGREGEHIFRLVYRQAGCSKPFQRLWISSMEESAIREGMAKLKGSRDYDSLATAADCRDKADWLVGMNASRLFHTAVGRVQTPTLNCVITDGGLRYSTDTGLLAALFLLTSNSFLWQRARYAVWRSRIAFEDISIRGITEVKIDNYAIYKAAKELCAENGGHIFPQELADETLVGESAFRLIVNAMLIKRYGLATIKTQFDTFS